MREKDNELRRLKQAKSVGSDLGIAEQLSTELAAAQQSLSKRNEACEEVTQRPWALAHRYLRHHAQAQQSHRLAQAERNAMEVEMSFLKCLSRTNKRVCVFFTQRVSRSSSTTVAQISQPLRWHSPRRAMPVTRCSRL